MGLIRGPPSSRGRRWPTHLRVSETFDELVRELLGDRTKKRNDSLLDHIDVLVHQLIEGLVSHLVLFGLLIVRLVSVTFHQIVNFEHIVRAESEHAVPGEVVVGPVQEVDMIPAVDAAH